MSGSPAATAPAVASSITMVKSFPSLTVGGTGSLISLDYTSLNITQEKSFMLEKSVTDVGVASLMIMDESLSVALFH